MGETYETGIIERIIQWKSGKGYFVKFAEVDDDFYAFGKCPVHEGDEVQYDYAQGSGAFTAKQELTHLSAKGKEVKKETPKAQPAKEAELTPKEYREKQIATMRECLADADEICGVKSMSTKDIAIALFDKRSTHLFWYLNDKSMAKP